MHWVLIPSLQLGVGVHTVTSSGLVVNTAFNVRVRRHFRSSPNVLAQVHVELVFG